MNQNHIYYEHNAQQFFNGTVGASMQPLHSRFLAGLPLGCSILDAGCGSGRDAKAFIDLGYSVTAFDASPALAELASSFLGQEVAVRSFQEMTEVDAYDGVWACASLLHVPQDEITDCLARLWTALKSGGVFYCSFKVGQGERAFAGRIFTDADETQLCSWLTVLGDVKEITLWRTTDVRPDRSETWLNALVYRV